MLDDSFIEQRGEMTTAAHSGRARTLLRCYVLLSVLLITFLTLFGSVLKTLSFISQYTGFDEKYECCCLMRLDTHKWVLGVPVVNWNHEVAPVRYL